MTRPWAWIAGVVLASSAGCGASAPRGPTTPMVMPEDRADRQAALERLGRRLFRAIADGRPTEVLLPEAQLATYLDAGAAAWLQERRLSLGTRLGASRIAALADTTLLGVCLQGSRAGRAGDAPGLVGAAWVVDRVLVAGERPDGRRIAAWVDGPFLYTDDGFWAVDLQRVEDPRWEHADLELGGCDMAWGLQ